MCIKGSLKILLFCTTILIYGCSTTSSENVKSQGIYAFIVVEAVDNTATGVAVTLNVGSATGTALILNGSDSLIATARGVTQTLTKTRDVFGLVYYITTFNFNVPGTEVVVSLSRPQDTSCPNSHVLMPDPFTVTAPSSGQSFNSQDTITVNWTPAAPAAGTINIDISTRCTAADGSRVDYSKSLTPGDTGTTSIPVASVLPVDSYDRTQACTCNVDVSRTADGILDPNYGEGGAIMADQSRMVSLVLHP